MTIWQLLETEPTKDKTAIKKAFAAQVKKHKPSDDAELYQLIREAYNAALAFADSDEEIEEETEETADAEAAENEERDDGPIIDKNAFFESIIKEIEGTELDESDDEIDETNIDDAGIEETEIDEAETEENETDSDSKLDEYERIFSAEGEESSPYDKNLFEKKTFALEDKLDYFEIVKLETSDEEKKLAIESGKNEKTKRTLIFFIAILVLICRCVMH
nr:hypothetical protein [Treponema sp.]